MTTKAEQERNLINLRRSKVSELLSKGYTSQVELSRILNVSESTISRDIAWYSERSKETFQSYLQDKLPEEFDKAITTFDYVIRKASYTADTTHDDKVKLQALKEMRETRTAKMDLISNHDVMSYQVNKGALPPKDIEEQPEQSPDLEGSNEDSDSTTEPSPVSEGEPIQEQEEE